jgi:hypothetical protein
MGFVQVVFDGKTVASVSVGDDALSKAKRVMGTGVETASRGRETIAIAKMIEAGLACKSPTDASHDVIVTIKGADIKADIKTLYPSYTARAGTTQEVLSDVQEKLDGEVAKEIRQGTQVLVDLSYLATAVREKIVGGIHNTYPKAITLEYDTVGAQLHVIYPTVFEYHKGNWYH